jgi:hypothetical protein
MPYSHKSIKSVEISPPFAQTTIMNHQNNSEKYTLSPRSATTKNPIRGMFF